MRSSKNYPFSRMFCVAMGLIGLALYASAEDVTAACTAISDAWAGVKEMVADVSLESSSNNGVTYSYGIAASKKVDGKEHARLDLIAWTEMMDQEQPLHTESNCVIEGDHILSRVIFNDEPPVYRTMPITLVDCIYMGGLPLLELLKSCSELSLAGIEPFNNRTAYRINAAVQPNMNGQYPINMIRCWFDQKTGLCLCMEFGQPTGEAWLKVTWTPQEPTPSLKDDYFTLPIPKGTHIEGIPVSSEASAPEQTVPEASATDAPQPSTPPPAPENAGGSSGAGAKAQEDAGQ